MNAKRSLLALVCLTVLFALLSSGTFAIRGQGNPTPPPTPNGPSNKDILEQAMQTANDAVTQGENAVSVVGNANIAVSTSQNALRIATGAALVGIILVVIISVLGVLSAIRVFRETRVDLAKAKVRIGEMRADLRKKTEQVQAQAGSAIHALAVMQLAEQQLQRRNIKGAIQMYRRAYDLDPANSATNYFLGELLLQDKQLEQGIVHLERVVGGEWEFAPAEAALGLALRLQAEQTEEPSQRAILYVQAESRLLRALQIDPAALDVHGEPVQAVLGGLYKRQGRVDEAIYRYEEARAIAPDKSYPIVNLAILYYMQGNIAKARAFFTRVEASASITLEQNSFDYWSRFDRLTAALALGKTAEALHDLQIIEQQLKTVSPLESAVGELMRLKSAPQPPEGIDTVIAQIQAMIKRIGRGKGAS